MSVAWTLTSKIRPFRADRLTAERGRYAEFPGCESQTELSPYFVELSPVFSVNCSFLTPRRESHGCDREDQCQKLLLPALITAHGIESVSSLTLSTRLCRLLWSHTRSWNVSDRTNPRPVVFYESWPTP